ncbi:MAG: porin [Hyphomicrobiales bacterium]
MKNIFKYSAVTLVSAALFGGLPAKAADLGGDCCADLEERVAVLEATTARKGNRKVSLTISGWVHKSILYWDDGIDSDVYAGLDDTNGSTRFRFTGSASINSDWSAGYNIEIETNGDRTLTVTQTNDDNGAGIALRKSNMWIKSKQLGQVVWGLASPVTDDMTLWSTFGAVFARQADWVEGALFNITPGNAGSTTVNDLTGSLNGFLYFEGATRNNIVRYNAPTIGGFTVSASWGEDDFWDVGARYKQTMGDFLVKAAIGYSEFGGGSGNDISGATRGYTQEDHFLANAGIMHSPTGLFARIEYSAFDWSGSTTATDLDSDGYSIHAGITQKWNALGKTTLMGSYTEIEDGYVRASFAEVANGSSTEATRFGLTAIQNIDAAAMQLYVAYTHSEFEINNVDQKDIDMINVGGVIKF